jgi:uncharacterized protein
MVLNTLRTQGGKRMKAKLFTHTDLDGVGCAIVFRSLFPDSEGHIIDVSYYNYDKIDSKVQNFVNSKASKDYDYIFITDISVNEETAVILEDVHNSLQGPFVQLLDHHDTAKSLNEYDWAYVDSQLWGVPGHKSSGTSLVIDFFERQRPGFQREISHGLAHFAETVRKYDTWEWTTHYNEILPKELNDYLYMVGREEFAQLMLATIPSNEKDKEVYFDVKARALLDQKQKEIKAYIEKKDKQIDIRETKHGLMGLVFAEQHVSELGNELCKKHEDLAFVTIVDVGERKVSFRTIRDDIHLGEMAKELGGGGHPKAAGAEFSEDKVIAFLGNLF